MRVGIVALSILGLLAPLAVSAQQPGHGAVKVSGDTGIAPQGCSTKAAVSAIATWFRAFQNADSAGFASVVAAGKVEFSIKGFSETERFWAARDVPEMVARARERQKAGEKMVLREVRLARWITKGAYVNGEYCPSCVRARIPFTPVFERRAMDLPRGVHLGRGKGEFECGRGLIAMNLAPCMHGGLDYCRRQAEK